jgi:hypothetical protein
MKSLELQEKQSNPEIPISENNSPKSRKMEKKLKKRDFENQIIRNLIFKGNVDN